jgi:hypothetical protein
MLNPSIERLLALVCRELGAESARLLGASEDEPHADNVLNGKLPDGRRLAVVFAGAPTAKGALTRRLQMLTSTFAYSLEEGASPRRSSRPPPSRSLHEELRALSVRARAVDAAVIDAHSPVVWGCASAEKDPPMETLALEQVSTSRLPEFDDSASSAPLQDTRSEEGLEDASAPPPERIRELTERAIDLVRDLPAVAGLRKGGHLAHAVRDANFGWVARSFASIYVLIVVFDSPFDELRAEQAIEDGLPRIERLVLALPPLDPKPAPMASVISMRGRARRR